MDSEQYLVEDGEVVLNMGKYSAVVMTYKSVSYTHLDVYKRQIDMSVFDLYSGKCEFVKAGASTTFVKFSGKVETIKSTSLPIGVLPKLDVYKRQG